MKHSINKIITLLLFAVLPACGDEAKTTQGSNVVGNDKETIKKAEKKEKASIGAVVITLNGETYELELAKCSFITKDHSVYLINTKKEKDNPKAPLFTSQGTSGKGLNASYTFKPEGSEMHGGTTYSGEMPFEQFQNNELIFKGEAKSFNLGDGITAIRGVEAIEFKVTCY